MNTSKEHLPEPQTREPAPTATSSAAPPPDAVSQTRRVQSQTGGASQASGFPWWMAAPGLALLALVALAVGAEACVRVARCRSTDATTKARPPTPGASGSRALPALPARLALPAPDQVTTPAGHAYATPSRQPFATGPASEHIHIYETPPCFSAYDYAALEIDTTMLGAPLGQRQS